MHVLIAWSGFLGAWLLVAGPLFQAATELQQEEDQRHSLGRAARLVGPEPRLSPWWWLLPPVAYVKQRRAQRSYRQAVFDAMTKGEIEHFVSFSQVATGWAMVSFGAFFIGIKETWELVEDSGWPGWLLPVLVLVMVWLSALNTVVRTRRSHDMLNQAESHATEAAQARAAENA